VVTNQPADSRVIHDVACTACGCVCDDLSLTVENNRIVEMAGACELAQPWLAGQNQVTRPAAERNGQPVELSDAIAEAAALLRSARYPVIYGLSRSSTDGQRAAVALADALGATIDTTASEGHATSLLALQSVGESTCSLGEVRNRADLVLFWGADPVVTHPRHLERYSLWPQGQFVPRGREDRTLIVVDSERTATAELADVFLQVPRHHDFEALWTLRLLLRGEEPRPDSDTGLPLAALRDLAERLKQCRYGVAFFGYGLARQPLGHRVVEALLQLSTDLNDFTRFSVRRLRMVGNVSGADNVLCWQTGFPFSVNLSRGYPRYDPGEYSAAEVLARGEADVALFVGCARVDSFPAAALKHLSQIPTILLDHAAAQPCWSPTLRFTTAVYGVHRPGTAYRMDDVPIPLRAVLETDYPSDGEVLRAIHQETQGLPSLGFQ
jgi:formylmethanofuran dehydrogenase subunit B